MKPSRRTSRIISPPPRKGGICLEQLLAAPEHADAGRPEHLVAGEGEEVDPERAHVDGAVRDELGAVGERRRAPARVGGGDDRVEVDDRAEHVRHAR